MAQNRTYEFGDYERMLERALRIKTEDTPCPRCANTTYFFLGPITGPWLDICCQNCGFRLEYLIDILLEGLDAEEDNVD